MSVMLDGCSSYDSMYKKAYWAKPLPWVFWVYFSTENDSLPSVACRLPAKKFKYSSSAVGGTAGSGAAVVSVLSVGVGSAGCLQAVMDSTNKQARNRHTSFFILSSFLSVSVCYLIISGATTQAQSFHAAVDF